MGRRDLDGKEDKGYVEIIHPNSVTPDNFPSYALTAWDDRNRFIRFVEEKLEELKKELK